MNEKPMTVAEAKQAYDDALTACNEAWYTQTRTTCDEGFTIEQANAAIHQAHLAEQARDAAYDALIGAYVAEDWFSYEDDGEETEPCRQDLYVM